VDDPSQGVVPDHCLARSDSADLVVAKAIGSGAPGAGGEGSEEEQGRR